MRGYPTPRDPVQEAREAALVAYAELGRVISHLDRDDPARQEADQARLAVAVLIDTLRGS